MGNLTICVYGASSDAISDIYKYASYELGFEIASRNDSIIFGGGSTGVMGAVSKGAQAAGGKITGIVPRFMNSFQLVDKNIGDIHWVDSMEERKRIMESRSDAFIVAPGGVGTFDELFQAITLNTLERFNKPVILYNVDGFYDDLIKFLVDCYSKGFIKAAIDKIVFVCSEPSVILDHLHSLLDQNS